MAGGKWRERLRDVRDRLLGRRHRRASEENLGAMMSTFDTTGKEHNETKASQPAPKTTPANPERAENEPTPYGNSFRLLDGLKRESRPIAPNYNVKLRVPTLESRLRPAPRPQVSSEKTSHSAQQETRAEPAQKTPRKTSFWSGNKNKGHAKRSLSPSLFREKDGPGRVHISYPLTPTDTPTTGSPSPPRSQSSLASQ